MIKKALITFSLVLSLSSPAFAGNKAKIVSVKPVYADNFVTLYEDRCYEVKVPSYRYEKGARSGDVLTGMIVGGLLGKGISGDDSGAAIGAVIGGVAAGEKRRRVFSGYVYETRCEKVQRQVNQPFLSHYTIRYKWNGEVYKQETNRHYHVGDIVMVNPIVE